MSSFSSDSDDRLADDQQITTEYDDDILGPLKMKNMFIEQHRMKKLSSKEFKEKLANLTLWFSLRLVSLFVVAYSKDIASPTLRSEQKWEEYADACIKERGSINSDSAEGLRNTEYRFFKTLHSNKEYANGMTLEAMHDSIIKLMTDHPKRTTFLRVCGFQLFVSFIDVEETLDIRASSPFPPVASTYALINILSSISDKDIAECITHNGSCFRDSRIGRWVNFVAKYPPELSGSSRLSERAARLVERWKKVVDDAQRGVLETEHTSEEDGYDDDEEQMTKEKRRNRDILERERQMTYIAATLAQGEDMDDDGSIRHLKV